MTLVSMKDMLQTGFRGKYAVGQFNLNNLEFTQAILQAAQQEQALLFLALVKLIFLIWVDCLVLWEW